ncbi:unnamed protein product [Mucor fragilis]
MTIPTKTSKLKLRKKPSKPKQIDQISEKQSKKIKAPSSTKPVPSKKVKNQLDEEAKVEKVQKKKTRSSNTINPKQTSNAAIITTSNATKAAIGVKKREKTDPHKQAIKATVEKKSSTKKLKKQSSVHTLPSPSPPLSTPIPAKRPPLKQCVSRATSTTIGIDMSTQTDPIVEAQLIKPTYQNHCLDVRDFVPVSALKITLEELMDSMQIVEKQRAAIPIKNRQLSSQRFGRL